MSRPAIDAGEILIDELTELGITPTELSPQINVPPNRVRQTIYGRRGITGDTALRFGHWFGTSAQFWLNLQSAYDISVDRVRRARRAGYSGGQARGRESRGKLPRFFFSDVFLTEAPRVPTLFSGWIEAQAPTDGRSRLARRTRRRGSKKQASVVLKPAKRRAGAGPLIQARIRALKANVHCSVSATDRA